jgi:hypothetical protein
MIQSSNNIWQQIIPTTQNSSTHTLFAKKLNKIKICIQDKSSIQTNIAPPYILKMKRKRGRRNLKSGELYEVALHTKDNDDNIKRKVKTHFHNFIVAFLNMLIKNTIKTKRLYKFRKMSSKITQDITISYNKKLMETSIKDILVQVSHKFKNKDINLYYIEKISQIKGGNTINNLNINTLNEILNIPYKDMMNNFYLKSTKKLFENEKNDESFEKHIENLINKYGYNYAMKFKQNAENFVNFYINSKQRTHKNSTEINSLSINDKDKQNDIKNLKLFLNQENDILNTKNGKKFFEIIRDNSAGDNSKCNTIQTQSQSQSGSSDGGSIQDENEKNEKENKMFLNKKRGCLFNVFLFENETENK